MIDNCKTIFLEPSAPAKPAYGAPCNGCGVCCLAEPCPVGMLLSRRRHGACSALRWDAAQSVYRCGVLTQPQDVVGQALHRRLQRLAGPLAALLRIGGARWIAAGKGCDSWLVPAPLTIDAMATSRTTLPACSSKPPA